MSIPAHVAKVAAGEPVRPFWRRQLDGSPTAAQATYDVVCGIVLPVFCFLADPGVFSEGAMPFGAALLPDLALPAYAFAAASIPVLLAWLISRRRAPALAGPLFAGAVGALALGIVMAPITVAALILLIGFLGFAPFLTAFAFLRNGIRAARAPGWTPARVTVSVLVALVLSIGIPLAASAHVGASIDRALRDVRSDRPAERREGAETLRRYRFLVRRTDFASAAERAPATERERLRQAYRDLTGRWSFEPAAFD